MGVNPVVEMPRMLIRKSSRVNDRALMTDHAHAVESPHAVWIFVRSEKSGASSNLMPRNPVRLASAR
jgi:hypothetical protein